MRTPDQRAAIIDRIAAATDRELDIIAAALRVLAEMSSVQTIAEVLGDDEFETETEAEEQEMLDAVSDLSGTIG